MVRLFICVEISNPSLIHPIELVMKKISIKGIKKVKLSHLHLTLKFLGETSDSKIPIIKESLSNIIFNPISLTLSGMGCFPNQNRIRIVWLGIKNGNQRLADLARMIDTEMQKIGFPSEKRNFSPHLTLARVKRLEKREKEQLKIILKEKATFLFGEQEIQEIILKKSTLTPSGPIYDDLLKIPAQSSK